MMLVKKSPWDRLTHFVEFHRRPAVLVVLAFMLVGAGALTLGYVLQPKPTKKEVAPTNNAQSTEVAANGTVTYYSPLTGVQVANEAATKKEVTAIMIENSPAARPQSGLKAAGVVYEAIAEGGITRFLTLHQEDRPQLIGPVRSLRPYYIDWLAPFDASVAHVGGSANALGTIRNGTFKDIDQFFNGAYYWRSTDRYAPHNVYTSFDKLDALNTSKGYVNSNFTGFMRKLDSPATALNAKSIGVDISSADYDSNYSYDAASNSYLRSEGGAPHVDRESGQINPHSVVVIRVPMTTAYEDGYREQMTTTGYNQAYIFEDGTVFVGLWRKDSQRAQIQFYDQNGIPIALNAGQTWITAVNTDRSVSWQ